MNVLAGISDIARIPQARLSSVVQQLAVGRQTEEDLLEGASVVPLQDMNTWLRVSNATLQPFESPHIKLLNNT